jgi:hypothetical protein
MEIQWRLAVGGNDDQADLAARAVERIAVAVIGERNPRPAVFIGALDAATSFGQLDLPRVELEAWV